MEDYPRCNIDEYSEYRIFLCTKIGYVIYGDNVQDGLYFAVSVARIFYARPLVTGREPGQPPTDRTKCCCWAHLLAGCDLEDPVPGGRCVAASSSSWREWGTLIPSTLGVLQLRSCVLAASYCIHFIFLLATISKRILWHNFLAKFFCCWPFFWGT
jgi:hypothetical protein